MTTANYAKRFSAAMAVIDPRESVNRIKNAVIDEIKALDPRAHLAKTEYFNHTYAPDLVASWDEGDGHDLERFIYIRSDTDMNHLLEDMKFVQENKPIVFSLSLDSPWQTHYELQAELANASRDNDTLVTDITGIAELIENQSSLFLKLVSSSLAKGGRGLIDQTRAVSTSRVLKDGFDGAISLEREPTFNAVEVIDSYLNRDYSRKMRQLLQAVWVGAGGELTDFPGGTELSGKISDDALYFLLTYDEIDDAGFWRRVGKNISLNQIGRLDLTGGSINLEYLMKYNIDTFLSRCARVTLYDPEDRAATVRKWFTRANLVGFRQQRFDAMFADKVEELGRAAVSETGIRTSELRSRGMGIIVDQVELTASGKQVRYSSNEGINVLDDDSLEAIADTLGNDARIRRAEVLIDDIHHVSCDFTTLTASGRTSSKIQLGLLARKCLPLLVDLRHNEQGEVDDAFTPTEGPSV